MTKVQEEPQDSGEQFSKLSKMSGTTLLLEMLDRIELCYIWQCVGIIILLCYRSNCINYNFTLLYYMFCIKYAIVER